MHLLQQMGLILGLTCRILEDSILIVLYWIQDCIRNCHNPLRMTMCYHTMFVWNHCRRRLCEKIKKGSDFLDVYEEEEKKGKMWNGQNKKTTKEPQLSIIGNCQGKTYCNPSFSLLTRPTCWCRRWTRKHHKRLLCSCVLGEERRKVRCEMDQLKQQRTNNYQQLARQDLLRSKVVTLDTSHLLRSALNKEILLKAVVLGRRKKKKVRYEMDQIKQQQQEQNKNINNWQGKTYYSTCLSHLTRPTCWCRRWTFQRKRRLLRLGGERRKCTCKMWDG